MPTKDRGSTRTAGNRTYAMEEAYGVLRRDYPLNEKNLDWWASSTKTPPTRKKLKRFDI